MKLIIRIVGGVLLLLGVVLTVVGAVDFFSAFGKREIPKLFWLMMLGLPLIGIGAGFSFFGFSGAIQSYAAKESVPAVKPLVSAASDALQNKAISCPHCQTENDGDDKFCKACGKPLVKICDACGKPQDADAKFCGDCGKEL